MKVGESSEACFLVYAKLCQVCKRQAQDIMFSTIYNLWKKIISGSETVKTMSLFVKV